MLKFSECQAWELASDRDTPIPETYTPVMGAGERCRYTHTYLSKSRGHARFAIHRADAVVHRRVCLLGHLGFRGGFPRQQVECIRVFLVSLNRVLGTHVDCAFWYLALWWREKRTLKMIKKVFCISLYQYVQTQHSVSVYGNELTVVSVVNYGNE